MFKISKFLAMALFSVSAFGVTYENETEKITANFVKTDVSSELAKMFYLPFLENTRFVISDTFYDIYNPNKTDILGIYDSKYSDSVVTRYYYLNNFRGPYYPYPSPEELNRMKVANEQNGSTILHDLLYFNDDYFFINWRNDLASLPYYRRPPDGRGTIIYTAYAFFF